jgi:hypothetical protein
MLSPNVILLLEILCGAVLAVPLNERATGKTFSLDQIPVKRSTLWTTALSVRRAHLKYGFTVPGDVEEAASRDETPNRTTLQAMPVRTDQMYVINVQVGNKNMSLDLDTGSSDL